MNHANPITDMTLESARSMVAKLYPDAHISNRDLLVAIKQSGNDDDFRRLIYNKLRSDSRGVNGSGAHQLTIKAAREKMSSHTSASLTDAEVMRAIDNAIDIEDFLDVCDCYAAINDVELS